LALIGVRPEDPLEKDHSHLVSLSERVVDEPVFFGAFLGLGVADFEEVYDFLSRCSAVCLLFGEVFYAQRL